MGAFNTSTRLFDGLRYLVVILGGITGIERFAEIIDTPVTFQDAPDAVPLQPGPGEIRRDPV